MRINVVLSYHEQNKLNKVQNSKGQDSIRNKMVLDCYNKIKQIKSKTITAKVPCKINIVLNYNE